MTRRAFVIAVAALFLILPVFSANVVAAGSVNNTTLAGYQVTGPSGSITRIKGSWVVPTLDCATTPDANMSISVMLDGVGSKDRMQIGTIAACVGGTATYRAFEVLSPMQGKEKVPILTISPGDRIEAQGKWSPVTHGWHNQIIDESTGVTKTGSVNTPSSFKPPLNSGSFVVSNNGVSSLSAFGQVGFGNQYSGVKQTCIVTAVLSGGTTDRVISLGALSSQAGFTLNQITMVDSHGNTMATTSALASDGESFTVAWTAST